MKKLNKLEAKVFNFLNDLRDSGEVNLFGSSPYITKAFGLRKKEANDILFLWIKNFDEDRVWNKDDEIKDKI